MKMNKALVVIDLQTGVHQVEAPLFELDRVIQGVNQRIRTYREAGDPVIFIQHEDSSLVKGSTLWQLLPGLDHQVTDHYCGKTHANSFYQTDLVQILQELAVDKLEFCGAQVEYCVDTTIRFAHGLGYQLRMKRGLATTTDSNQLKAPEIIAHHEAIWDHRFLEFI